jgi:hypothetical protein
MRKNNLSKYQFKNLKFGDSFFIDKNKNISMKNSLRRFNKAHKTNICVEYTPEIVDGVEKLRVLVTSPEATPVALS